MKNAQIIRLEAELARHLAAATTAQKALSAARNGADLPDPQAFFTRAEVRAIKREKAAEFREVIPIIMDAARGTKGPYANLAAAAANAVPATRAELAWIDMLAMADEIVKAQARGETPSVEMAQDFLKANAIAAGKVTELPADETARAIIRAGARRRGEI
jgi:hypothetical protein